MRGILLVMQGCERCRRLKFNEKIEGSLGVMEKERKIRESRDRIDELGSKMRQEYRDYCQTLIFCQSLVDMQRVSP